MTLLPSLNQCITKTNLYVYLTDGRADPVVIISNFHSKG